MFEYLLPENLDFRRTQPYYKVFISGWSFIFCHAFNLFTCELGSCSDFIHISLTRLIMLAFNLSIHSWPWWGCQAASQKQRNIYPLWIFLHFPESLFFSNTAELLGSALTGVLCFTEFFGAASALLNQIIHIQGKSMGCMLNVQMRNME